MNKAQSSGGRRGNECVGLGRGSGMCFGSQLATFLPQDYSVEGMSDSLLNFLQHLREFGLVFQRKV